MHDVTMPFIRQGIEISRTHTNRSRHWGDIEEAAAVEWRWLLDTLSENSRAIGALAVEFDVDDDYDGADVEEATPVGYAYATEELGELVLRGVCVAEGRGRPGLVGALVKDLLSKFDDHLMVRGHQNNGMLRIIAERGFDSLPSGSAPLERYDGIIPPEMNV